MNPPSILIRLLLSLGLLSATALQAGPSTGGDFALGGAAVSGGGRSDGGEFALAGSAGQPAGGEVAGGEFTLSGGLIGVIVVPGDAVLELVRMADGEARLSWSAAAGAVVLESSPALGEGAEWRPATPAPTDTSYDVPLNQPARFFRLRRSGP